jgi:hypothetical protein
MWNQTLDDGSLPHGVCYGSKHGDDLKCWAIWLRAMDDGKPESSEPTRAGQGFSIEKCERNEPLRTIARLFGLTVF